MSERMISCMRATGLAGVNSAHADTHQGMAHRMTLMVHTITFTDEEYFQGHVLPRARPFFSTVNFEKEAVLCVRRE